MATLGTVGYNLASPKSGYQRIDDANSAFSYIGTWTNDAFTDHLNGYAHMSGTIGSEVRFNFTGTKIMIISYGYSYGMDEIDLFIDNTKITTMDSLITSTYARCVIADVTNLTDQEHCVRIVTKLSGQHFYLEAIDIATDKTISAYKNLSTYYQSMTGGM